MNRFINSRCLSYRRYRGRPRSTGRSHEVLNAEMCLLAPRESQKINSVSRSGYEASYARFIRG